MDEEATPIEPVTTVPDPVADTPITEPVSELTQTLPETPTPQLPANEALPKTTPEPDRQGAVAPAEAPKVETPTPTPAPIPDASPTEEPPRTPPKIQQGTTQSEPTQQQEPSASHPESLPAQAKTIATPPRNILMQLLTKAHLVTQLRKQKKLLKVMGLFAKKKSITNDDVEKLLHVSDATASRYLGQLTKENKITQIGKTGQGVTYTKR